MIIRSKPLNRRTLLRGTGVAIGLPLLEAMAPIGKTAFAQQQKPTRFMSVFTPVGYVIDYFHPEDNGRNYTLSPTLKGLAPVKDSVLVLKNVYNNAQNPQPVGGAHAHGTGCFLTGVKIPRSGIRHSVSVDQVLADIVEGQTPIRSMHISPDPLTRSASSKCDVAGQGCAFTHHMGWNKSGNFIPNMTDPQKIFSLIYGNVGGGEQSGQGDTVEKSVLDFVMDDIEKVSGRLGQADRLRVEEYLNAVREVEVSIGGGSGGNGASACQNPERPELAGQSPDVPGRVAQRLIDLFVDLAVLAFQCDATRVITMMTARGASQRRYNDLLSGVPSTGHHNLSHHNKNAKQISQLRKIEEWQVERFVRMVQRFKDAKDPAGDSILDSSILFTSSEVNEGQRHRYFNMPFLLAGTANGRFKTGECISLPNGQNDFCNLYETFIDVFGNPKYGKFGDYGGGKVTAIMT